MPAVSATTASPAPASPEQDSVSHAHQIVSVNEDGTSFTLDAKALGEVFSKVPQDTKVAIISVVGAFRTGKSYLLDLILRYLRYGSPTRIIDVAEGVSVDSEGWKKWAYEGLDGSGEATLEGNSNEAQTHGEKGFSWRAGHKRNTTGIWMWETPFIRKSELRGEDIAVFLVDTQGLLDSETSQMLTASIFGLSTLLSSYQTYNVDKRVQEDNLQHLALFTEYGRMALMSEKTSKEALSEKLSPKKNDAKSTKRSPKAASTNSDRPFQNLDFLVRDWQEFLNSETLLKKRADMAEYTNEVFSSRTQKDLADTREQILSCFDRLQCFMLPHPGLPVTRRDYDGSITAIESEFLALLTTYLDDLTRNTWSQRRSTPFGHGT